MVFCRHTQMRMAWIFSFHASPLLLLLLTAKILLIPEKLQVERGSVALSRWLVIPLSTSARCSVNTLVVLYWGDRSKEPGRASLAQTFTNRRSCGKPAAVNARFAVAVTCLTKENSSFVPGVPVVASTTAGVSPPVLHVRPSRRLAARVRGLLAV